MPEPLEYSFWGYWGSIAMKIPKFLLHSYKDWFASINLILFLAALSNKKIAEFLGNHWQGVSPRWSLIFIAILVLWSIMVAIHERDKEVYLAYKTADDKLEQLQDYNYMSLKEACDKLNEEKYNRFGYSIGAILVEQSDVNTHYDRLAKYFVEVDTIYGKSPSSAFAEWRIINKAKFTSGKVKMEEGELVLYGAGTNVGKTSEYSGLVIEEDNLLKDIYKIMLGLYIPFREVIQKLYDECEKDPTLAKVMAHIRGKFSFQNGLLNILAFYYKYILIFQIYGRNIQSDELTPIYTDQIDRMYFDNEGSSLYSYPDRVKIYTDLYIKRDHNYLLSVEVFKQELNEISGYSKHSKP